jgi:DNA-binding transcriptional LysR family regulator
MQAHESFDKTLLTLELRQLRQLAAVFEHGSISAAAKHLGMQQPTLSRSMSAIERTVGVPLFGRGPTGVAPTDYGRALLQYHRALEANLRNAAGELDAIRGVPPAMIRLGVGPIEGADVAATALSRYLERYPDAQIAIREGLYANLEPLLAKGELDLILGSEPSITVGIGTHPGMNLELLGSLRPAIVVRAAHPLAKKRRVTLDDLQQARWIVPFGNTTSAERFRATFAENGLMPPAGSVFAPISSWTAAGLVAQTDVVALMPQQLYRREIASGAFKELRVPEPAFAGAVYLITREETRLSTPVRSLLRDIREASNALNGVFR